jgi:hypothetical protein
MSVEEVNKCVGLINKLAPLTIEVSLPGRGRSCLKKPGLIELAKDLGVSVRSRMTKADLWDAILLTKYGEDLAEYIAGIVKEHALVGPESMESVVELSWKGDDEDMMNTGVHSAGPGVVAPVLRDENNLEQILYLYDVSPRLSNVEVRAMEEIKIKIEELRSDWISKIKNVGVVKRKAKEAKYDALAPRVAEDLYKGVIVQFLESFWDASFEQKIDSPEIRNLSRTTYKTYTDREGNEQKSAKVETLLQAIANGSDTFFNKSMTIINRYEGEYGSRRARRLLVLTPTESLKASEFKIIKKRFTALTRLLSITKKLRKNYWEKVKPSAKLQARWDKFNVRKEEVGKAFNELKAAKENIDTDAVDALYAEMSGLNWETKSAFWNEFQWMVHIPEAPEEDRYRKSTWEVLGDLYSPGMENIDAAFPWNEKSTNESRRANHERYHLANGASKASGQRFVDNNVAYGYLGALDEESVENGSEMSEEDISILLNSGYTQEDLGYLEESPVEASDEQILEAFNF